MNTPNNHPYLILDELAYHQSEWWQRILKLNARLDQLERAAGHNPDEGGAFGSSADSRLDRDDHPED